MSERYTKLFSLPENQYVHGAPILLAAGALLRDNRSETMLAQLKFWNISEKTIIAVMVEVDAFDVSGAALEGVTKYPYLDLSAERDIEFGQRQAIPLPDANTRRIVARVIRVVFSDNSLWEPDGAADWLPLPEPTPIIAALPSKLAEQYRRDTTEEAAYLPEKLDGLWRCTCGALNQPEEAVCHECGISLDAQSEALNEKLLQEHLAAYETEKVETAAKAEKQSKRRNKITVIALLLIAVIAAAVVLISGAVRKNNAYQAAESFADAGQYKEAITAFEALGDYKDSREKADEIKETAYNRAVMLLDEEQYGEAKTLFEAFGSYKNSEKYNSQIQWKAARSEENYYSYLDKDSGEYEIERKTVLCTYNSQGKLTATERFDEDGVPEYRAIIDYDANGNRSKTTEYQSWDKAKQEYCIVITRDTDMLGHAVSLSMEDKTLGVVNHWEYVNTFSADGKLTEQTFYPENLGVGVEKIYYTYDENGNVTTASYTFKNEDAVYTVNGGSFTGTKYASIAYSYDEKGHISQIKYYGKNHSFCGKADITYQFDERGVVRYRKAVYPDKTGEEWTYDENGNQIQYTKTDHGLVVESTIQCYQWMYFPDF